MSELDLRKRIAAARAEAAATAPLEAFFHLRSRVGGCTMPEEECFACARNAGYSEAVVKALEARAPARDGEWVQKWRKLLAERDAAIKARENHAATYPHDSDSGDEGEFMAREDRWDDRDKILALAVVSTQRALDRHVGVEREEGQDG